MKNMKFRLTLSYPDVKDVVVNKGFLARSRPRAWKLAERWKDNCLAICGKNHNGTEPNTVFLELLNN